MAESTAYIGTEPRLSVILIAYNMRREITRTQTTLSPSYQRDINSTDYEVLLIDNGSPRPVDRAVVADFGPQFQYHLLADAPPSPARAINWGAELARGEILCLMIDGAHLLTPGTLSLALAAFGAFPNPVVMLRYFYLGPGSQNDTILAGYDQTVEDALLEEIGWPRDGYRLFEIAFPLPTFGPRISWFNRMLESNCLFLRKPVFLDMGGSDERFDFPGGGFLNIDILQHAAMREGTQLVQLIGEGSFHQIHGGITTNTDRADQRAKVESYASQFQAIRGRELGGLGKRVYFLGHLPTQHAKIDVRYKDLEVPVSDALKRRLGTIAKH
jgi:glycosyltransferase involved in cell wall biosynthesis